MYDVSAIENYVLYLKRECSLAVTLHPIGAENVITGSKLLAFNIHENPYCVYVKTRREVQEHCIKKQAEVLKTCENGSYIGVCHAGVKEFVYPIKSGDEIKGFISVSGYACPNFSSYLSAVHRKYALPKDELSSAYGALKKEMPSKSQVDVLIQPLCDMLELAYQKTQAENRDESFLARVVRFVKERYTQPITSEILCKQFHCSRSHLSHTFNSAMGCSLSAFVTSLRLESAKLLLSSSFLSVTEIAFSVGFSDCNYFSSVFKKATGFSPSAYRKQHR